MWSLASWQRNAFMSITMETDDVNFCSNIRLEIRYIISITKSIYAYLHIIYQDVIWIHDIAGHAQISLCREMVLASRIGHLSSVQIWAQGRYPLFCPLSPHLEVWRGWGPCRSSRSVTWRPGGQVWPQGHLNTRQRELARWLVLCTHDSARISPLFNIRCGIYLAN
jgi:hypothetical protein